MTHNLTYIWSFFWLLRPRRQRIVHFAVLRSASVLPFLLLHFAGLIVVLAQCQLFCNSATTHRMRQRSTNMKKKKKKKKANTHTQWNVPKRFFFICFSYSVIGCCCYARICITLTALCTIFVSSYLFIYWSDCMCIRHVCLKEHEGKLWMRQCNFILFFGDLVVSICTYSYFDFIRSFWSRLLTKHNRRHR